MGMAIAMPRLRGSRRMWIDSLRAMAQTRNGFMVPSAMRRQPGDPESSWSRRGPPVRLPNAAVREERYSKPHRAAQAHGDDGAQLVRTAACDVHAHGGHHGPGPRRN